MSPYEFIHLVGWNYFDAFAFVYRVARKNASDIRKKKHIALLHVQVMHLSKTQFYRNEYRTPCAKNLWSEEKERERWEKPIQTHFIQMYENWTIIFTKVYCGLWMGYALCPQGLIDQTWNLFLLVHFLTFQPNNIQPHS